MSSPATTDVTVTFDGGMSFTGIGPSGHPIKMDAAVEVGGSNSAARPMEMLLAALGGCSGIDIALILRKMRISFDGFEVRLHATRADDHPRIFTTIEVEYVIKGSNLETQRAKLENAARLSFEKYCSVAGMLNKAAEMSWRVTVEETT